MLQQSVAATLFQLFEFPLHFKPGQGELNQNQNQVKYNFTILTYNLQALSFLALIPFIKLKWARHPVTRWIVSFQ